MKLGQTSKGGVVAVSRQTTLTVIFCTFLRPNLLGVADRGNGNISPSSKQLAKCSRIQVF